MIATTANAQGGAHFEIIDQRVVPSSDPKRAGKEDVISVIELPDGPRLLIRLPAETYSQEVLNAEVLSQTRATQKQVQQHAEILQRTELAPVPEPQSTTGPPAWVWIIVICAIGVVLISVFSFWHRRRA